MILTSASGSSLRLTDTVFTRGRTGISTKESGKCVLSMGQALISSILGTAIKASIRMASQMAMGNILGVMGLFTQANFTRVDATVKANGGATVLLGAIPMRGTMCMI